MSRSDKWQLSKAPNLYLFRSEQPESIKRALREHSDQRGTVGAYKYFVLFPTLWDLGISWTLNHFDPLDITCCHGPPPPLSSVGVWTSPSEHLPTQLEPWNRKVKISVGVSHHHLNDGSSADPDVGWLLHLFLISCTKTHPCSCIIQPLTVILVTLSQKIRGDGSVLLWHL